MEYVPLTKDDILFRVLERIEKEFPTKEIKPEPKNTYVFIYDKTCFVCQDEFKAGRKTARYCRVCADDTIRERRLRACLQRLKEIHPKLAKQIFTEAKKAKKPSTSLIARRKKNQSKFQKECPLCGETFYSDNKQTMYCLLCTHASVRMGWLLKAWEILSERKPTLVKKLISELRQENQYPEYC